MDSNENAPPAIPVSLPYAVQTASVPKRKLYVGTRILLALYMIPPILITVLATLRADPRMGGQGAGMLIVLFLAWGAALLAWRIFGRSNLAYNLTLILGTLLLLVGAGSARILRANRQRQLNQKVATFQADAAKLRQDTIDALDRGETIDRDSARKFVTSLDDVAKNSSGDDAIATQSVSAALSQLFDLGKKRDDAFHRFSEAGGINAGTLQTPEALDKRLRMIDEIVTLQEPIRSFRFDQAVAGEMSKRGAAPAATQAMVQSIKSNPDYDIQQKSFQNDYDAYLKYREILTFLKTNRAGWRHNEATKQVVFTKSGLLPEYNRLIQEARDLENKRKELIRGLGSGGH